MSTSASPRTFDLPPRTELPGTSEFYSVLTTIVRAGGFGAANRQLDEGKLRLSDRSERVLKALVGAGSVSGWTGGDSDVLRQGFYASLASSSAFFGLLPSMRKIPFYARIASVTQTLTAGVVAEGAPVPVQAITIGKPILEPTKISLITWMTQELSETLEAGPLIRAELTAAASRAVDAEFVSQLVAAGIPTTVASGVTLQADLRIMLDTVVTSAAAKPAWIASVDTALSLSMATATWPASSSGGSLLGYPLYVSDGVPGSSLLLIDAAAIAANSGPIDLSVSTSATLDPNTVPSIPPANLVNLFQTNSIAFKITVSFGAEPMRVTAAHLLTDVAAWDTAA